MGLEGCLGALIPASASASHVYIHSVGASPRNSTCSAHLSNLNLYHFLSLRTSQQTANPTVVSRQHKGDKTHQPIVVRPLCLAWVVRDVRVCG
ncbi:hypothetical protein P152DRAFT_161406 [Eremomyces bilateralis CBS 781.70]|uniref:Uncharacterized protein n=1 Tax=Eremomyces bilateralis CBS 781.70 TaxID=1392243 RepID=A0A6G1FUM2_9PEZI|nr:uncharacterized protein P152DRAFT_161406 [Eremomyces bilateralis CBS 781.70]KAF1809351.1 hypothetical protein P152DRAFT_161406 [Eremomyces bilateralis CBS 781.70]